jgi:hypothetical protein
MFQLEWECRRGRVIGVTMAGQPWRQCAVVRSKQTKGHKSREKGKISQKKKKKRGNKDREKREFESGTGTDRERVERQREWEGGADDRRVTLPTYASLQRCVFLTFSQSTGLFLRIFWINFDILLLLSGQRPPYLRILYREELVPTRVPGNWGD